MGAWKQRRKGLPGTEASPRLEGVEVYLLRFAERISAGGSNQKTSDLDFMAQRVGIQRMPAYACVRAEPPASAPHGSSGSSYLARTVWT